MGSFYPNPTLPVRGPGEGASCGSTARVSKLHLPPRGNCQLCAAMQRARHWEMAHGDKHFPAGAHCSTTVFNKACSLQVEKRILAWNHSIFYIGNDP